jgi:hypothetical protein
MRNLPTTLSPRITNQPTNRHQQTKEDFARMMKTIDDIKQKTTEGAKKN